MHSLYIEHFYLKSIEDHSIIRVRLQDENRFTTLCALRAMQRTIEESECMRIYKIYILKSIQTSKKKFILKTDADYRSSKVGFNVRNSLTSFLDISRTSLRFIIHAIFFSVVRAKRHRRRSAALQGVPSANWSPRELNVPARRPPPRTRVIADNNIT